MKSWIKVLFKDLNPGIAMAIVRFKFSRKLYFCFESVIRQKFIFSAFSEMAQNFWFWLHWMKRNYDFVLVYDKVSKFNSYWPISTNPDTSKKNRTSWNLCRSLLWSHWVDLWRKMKIWTWGKKVHFVLKMELFSLITLNLR